MRNLLLIAALLSPVAFAAGQVELADGTKMDGQVTRVIPAQVEIKTAAGSMAIAADRLSTEEYEKHFGMLPPPELKKRFQGQSDVIERLYAELDELKAPKTEAAPDGKTIQIIDFGATVVSRSSQYITASWKVRVANRGSEVSVLNVMFDFIDKDEFVLESRKEYSILVGAESEKLVTGTVMVKNDVWERVHSYVAKTEKGRP